MSASPAISSAGPAGCPRGRAAAAWAAVALAVTCTGLPAPARAQPVIEAQAATAGDDAARRLQRLIDDAEAAYQERRDLDAFARYAQLLAQAPGDAHGWLRIGNLWQRNGQDWRAMEAYRRAVDAAAAQERALGESAAAFGGALQAHRLVRAKAALNLALLGLQQVRSAAQSLDRSLLPAELQPAAESIERGLRLADTAPREPARPVLR